MMHCAFFGDDAKLHHIGLGVRSIREASPSSQPVVEKVQGVSIAFVDLNGVAIELLEPLDDESPIARSVKQSVKLLHLCYEVEDLEAAIETCRHAGFHRLGPLTPAHIFDGRRVAWVFSRHFGLFELLERTRKPEVSVV